MNNKIWIVKKFFKNITGDLKTYLLSRRNLVGQNSKEAEDVNADNLTKMAVDIASGLQYLHQIKYVHRSVSFAFLFLMKTEED